MCAAFMISCLQAGATLVERNRQVTYVNKVHIRHLSNVVLVDIFWKIDVVSVVDLDTGNWLVLNTLLRSCDFFPP